MKKVYTKEQLENIYKMIDNVEDYANVLKGILNNINDFLNKVKSLDTLPRYDHLIDLYEIIEDWANNLENQLEQVGFYWEVDYGVTKINKEIALVEDECKLIEDYDHKNHYCKYQVYKNEKNGDKFFQIDLKNQTFNLVEWLNSDGKKQLNIEEE